MDIRERLEKHNNEIEPLKKKLKDADKMIIQFKKRKHELRDRIFKLSRNYQEH